jgi:LuxR family maltose regulon positive regulatory protein
MKSRMLSRDHLLNRLSAGKDARLIIISGVAGSGKTSLVCDWIKKEKMTVAWYSLDESDNNYDVFFRYLLAALTSSESHLASMLGQWFQKQKALSRTLIVPPLIRCLTDLPKDIYLVLDDYHLVTSKRIHDSLCYLLNHIPPKIHVVVISRYCLPFSIARFKIRNQLTEISAEDMRFNEKETEQFFTEIMPAKLSMQQIHELTRYMEGWVGGLRLLGLSFKEKEGPRGLNDILSRAFQETTSYLIDEVIDGQPKKVKAFLYKTAVLERFNADLCREITGLSDAHDILAYVCSNNLFLTPLDNEHTWYRYHHLFSEVLRRRMKLTHPNTTSDVNRKGALWFSRNNYLEDAFQHAFAAGDYEFAADLLEDHLFLLYERFEVALALRWLEKLPHEIFEQRTLLRLYDCAFRIHSLELSDTEAVIMAIESHQGPAFERYEGFKRMLCQDLLVYLKYTLRYYRDVEEMDVCVNARKFPLENKLYGSLFSLRIMAEYYLLRGDLSQTIDILKDVRPIVLSSNNILARVYWFNHMAITERWQGRLHRSENTFREALDFLGQKGLSDTPLKYIFYLNMAWIFYFRNQLDEAFEYAAAASRCAEQAQTAYAAIEGDVLLYMIHRARGEREEEIESRNRQKMQWAARIERSPSAENLVYCLTAFLQMDIKRAEEYAAHRKFDLNQPYSLTLLFQCLGHAKLLYMQGRYQEAAHTLEVARTFCVNQNMREIMIDVDLLRSAVFWVLNESNQAKEIMEETLTFCATEGYIRQFINHAEIISPVLVDMARNTSNREGSSRYLMTVMKACGIDRNAAAVKENRNGNLSPREIQILKLMASGYSSYKQMAEKIFVSVDTIRAHTKHIYRKLDVNNRDQAIRRAEELKPLDMTLANS